MRTPPKASTFPMLSTAHADVIADNRMPNLLLTTNQLDIPPSRITFSELSSELSSEETIGQGVLANHVCVIRRSTRIMVILVRIDVSPDRFRFFGHVASDRILAL